MLRILIIGIPILLLLGVMGWRYEVKSATAAQLAQTAKARGSAPANVVLSRAGPRDIQSKLLIVGDAASPFNVNISPKVTGVIVDLNLREGQTVKAGQVVAKMDTEEIQGEIAQAQATWAEAEQRYTQAKLQQVPTNVGVYSGIGQQKANVASTLAEYNQSQANYAALKEGALATVTDAKAKTAAAQSAVQSAEAQVNSAKANVDLAQATYNRDYELYKQAFIAAQDVDQARTTFEVNKASLNVANKALDAAQSNLRSAQAEERNAIDQASITIKKGVADVVAAKALWTQARETLRNAVAQRPQIPAYVENLNALKSEAVADLGLLTQAKARLLWTTLTSPIDGVIVARNADPGATANPGAAILQIQYLKWLYLEGSVPVEQSADVHVGQSADIVFDAVPGRHFTGRVTRVNPSADPMNRQFMIYVELQNPDYVIRPGMYAKITIITSSVHADVAIPREAIHAGLNGKPDTVTVVDDQNVAHVVPVKLGVSDSIGFQVLSGVSPGQNVVVQAYNPVKDGQKVAVPKSSSKGGKGSSGAGGSGAAAGSTGAGAGTGSGS